MKNSIKKKNVVITEPFQGHGIGGFTVLAPTKARYLDLIVESEKTPEGAPIETVAEAAFGFVERAVARIVNLVKRAWGAETFSTEPTSAENQMSVVQYADIAGHTILLTGDAGIDALNEAADFLEQMGVSLPGIKRFQVPHHGSRRNVSTELLDRWIGPRLAQKPAEGSETFFAMISSAKEDPDHPRKAVERAFIHRGGRVYATEGGSIRFHQNAPARPGWNNPVTPRPYPEEEEE